MGPGVPLDWVTAEALLRHPGLFDEPMPPVGMMLAAAGFEFFHGELGLPGVTWEDEDDDLSADQLRARVSATVFLRALDGDDGHDGDNGHDGDDDDGMIAAGCRVFLRETITSELQEYVADLVETEPVEAGALAAMAGPPRHRRSGP